MGTEKGLQGGIVYRKTRTSLERMGELLDGDSQVLELRERTGLWELKQVNSRRLEPEYYDTD